MSFLYDIWVNYKYSHIKDWQIIVSLFYYNKEYAFPLYPYLDLQYSHLLSKMAPDFWHLSF